MWLHIVLSQEIKETGKGLGLTACQQGSAIIASLISTHIPPVSGTRANNQILFHLISCRISN